MFVYTSNFTLNLSDKNTTSQAMAVKTAPYVATQKRRAARKLSFHPASVFAIHCLPSRIFMNLF